MQQLPQGPVALVGRAGAVVDAVVERQVAAREGGESGAQLVPRGIDREVAVSPQEQAGAGDGTRVDHRVGAPVGTVLDGGQRVERSPGGVDADVVDDPIDPEASTGEGEDERLGHAHERERDVDVAGDELVPVDADDRDAEQRRIRLCQRGIHRADTTRVDSCHLGVTGRHRLTDPLVTGEVPGRDVGRTQISGGAAPRQGRAGIGHVAMVCRPAPQMASSRRIVPSGSNAS